MIEIPESIVLAKQLNETIKCKVIESVVANSSPHKFAWFHGDPDGYDDLLRGKCIGVAKAFGGKVEVEAEDMRLAFVEGVNLRYIEDEKKLPKKHQFLVKFTDSTYLAASIQMYGGAFAFRDGEKNDGFYVVALKALSPLSEEFDYNLFTNMMDKEGMQKLSVKAFLATEQRIPGLGNGVLQDILYNAKVNPKRKMNTLSDDEKKNIFASIKATLLEMVRLGGRDTEKDLFGNKGGYKTKASKFTKGTLCPKCGSEIVKKAYMGGSVYYCEGCQPI